MPIYEYECGNCRYRFEIKQGFDDEPQAVCPHCQGRAKRVFYAAPVIFKGSGFYVTDHRKTVESEPKQGDAARSDTKKSENSKSATLKSANKSEKGK